MKFIASSKAYSMVGDLRLEAEYIETLEANPSKSEIYPCHRGSVTKLKQTVTSDAKRPLNALQLRSRENMTV